MTEKGFIDDLFFPTGDARDFGSVLSEVQEFISKKYSDLLIEGNKDEVREQIKLYIDKYLTDKRICVEGLSDSELIDRLYTEMAEFSFLTKYIYGTGYEEININAWDDVEVQKSGKSMSKIDEHFDSPQHAINVVRRMLHVSGMVLDNATPAALGHLSKNIRISALKTPLVDEDAGVAASIRIVNPQNFKKEDFVRTKTATEDMMNFLSQALRYGVSTCVAGATGSGKTTFAGWLLNTIPDHKRILTIENGSREISLVRKRNGKTQNSVIHLLTRPSENEMQNIDQDILLDYTLRFNPDVICVGEMRGPEAYAATEASRTGHTVLTTIHANSCEATYRRMVTLCKRKHDISDEVLLTLVTEAFPLVVFTKQLEDRERKVMEIMECEILPNGERRFRTIYQYNIYENRYEDDRIIILGEHEKVNDISDSLQKQLRENGMPKSMLEEHMKGVGIKC